MISRVGQSTLDLEQELYRLAAIASHLSDDQVVELRLEDLPSYGFDVNLDAP